MTARQKAEFSKIENFNEKFIDINDSPILQKIEKDFKALPQKEQDKIKAQI